jgi:cell division protein FtsB
LKQNLVRRIAYLVGLALVAACGWAALKGPQGFETLIEKHREIRRLQEENIILSRENDRRRERIRRLEESPSEQQMEIRKQLKLQRQGETTFILPDAPKSSPESKPADPQE